MSKNILIYFFEKQGWKARRNIRNIAKRDKPTLDSLYGVILRDILK